MKNCKECTHSGRDCIPYIMALSQDDFLSWCAMRKKTLHLSNEDIAERSNVPKSTVDRLFSPRPTDCRFTTMQPIICTLSGCSSDELDCDNIERPSEMLNEQLKYKEEIIKHLEEENKRKNGVIDHLHITAKEDIERAKKEEAESLNFLKRQNRQKAKIICTLAIALGITLLIIIAALVIDMMNSNVGFFWLKALLPHGETIKEVFKASL